MSRAGKLHTDGDHRGGASGALHSDTAAATESRGTDLGGEDPSRLVIPEGLLIDDAVRERMQRTLRHLPQEVGGIAALLSDLPPGVSCRVHAEWKSLEPATAPKALQPIASPVRGAVLLRPGIPFSVAGDTVEVPGALVLCDAGAVVHNPRRPVGEPAVASEEGRPPFPRRPVVVLLALEAAARRAEWARRLANGLLRREVEARLAVPAPPEGLHLSRPCLPCEESIRALAPDAIVALDAGAAEHASQWCGSDRSTVVLELSEGLAGAVELVPWQIDRAQGRLRARIGPNVDPIVLGALIRRLCAGPQPVAPTDDHSSPAMKSVAQHATVVTRPRPAALLLSGSLDAAASTRLEGLVDYLAAESLAATVAPVEEGIARGAQSAPLVMLFGTSGSAGIGELIARRREARLTTVADVGPADLIRDRQEDAAPPRLARQAAAVASACGLVSAPAGAAQQAARDLGARTFALPTMISRTRAAALRSAARESCDDSDDLLLGWRLDTTPSHMPSYADAVVDALLTLLENNPGVTLHAVTQSGNLPARLRRHDRVVVTRESPAPEDLARWATHLFTPEMIGDEVADDLGRFLEASLAGVPSVLPLAARRAIDGHPSPQLVVRDPDDPAAWLEVLRNVLRHDDKRARRRDETLRYTTSVNSYASSRAVVNRFMGWALYEGDR